MAATATSPQYDNQQTSKRIEAYDAGKVRCASFEYVNNGTADKPAGVKLITLPAGKVRVIPQLSAIWVSENGADESFVDGSVIDVGYALYNEPDGTEKSADDDYWVVDFNPASTHEKRFALPAGGGAADVGMPKVFNTKSGLTITMDVETQDMKVGAKVYGEIFFVQGN